MNLSHPLRASLFVVTGVYLLAYWVIADPSPDESTTVLEAPIIIGFSTALLLLACATLLTWSAAAFLSCAIPASERNVPAVVSAEVGGT